MFRFTSLLLFALGLGMVSSSHYKKLFMKYGEKKILESCFGEQKIKEVYHKFYHSMAECKAEQGGTMASRSKAPPTKPAFDWDGFFGKQRSSQQLDGPAAYLFNRQKRSHHVPFNAEKIRNLKGAYLTKLKLGACVLQKLDVLDANLEMNWPAITKYYQSAEVEPELKEDLMEVLDKCKKFATCTTAEAVGGKFPVGVKQAMMFMKCEKKKKCLACVKKDLRKGAAMFELEGLDGLLDGSPYDEPDEQMLKVLMLQLKFGDNDFALFE